MSDDPFGDEESNCNIWRVAVTDSGRLVFSTSDGLYTGKINAEGGFEGENQFLTGCNVERSQVVTGEFIMCSIKEGVSSKLKLICLENEDASTIY